MYNTQQNSDKYFISSQGKSKRDLNHSYDMPRTHSTQTLKSFNKSNNNTSYIQTSTNQPYKNEHYSYIDTNDIELAINDPIPKDVDRSFQYIKTQFNLQNDLSINYNDRQSCLNNSFTPMISEQNNLSLNYSMNIPQSTKNVNMTDIMYSTNKRGTQDYKSTKDTKPQHHLQQIFTMARDRSGQRFIQQQPANMSMLSHTFEMEDDYRLQLIYLRLWQKAIRTIKQRRINKKVFLKNLATAIHFHEQSLMTKAVLSFIKFRVLNEQRTITAMKVSKKVFMNIKRFYMGQLIKKFKESRWIQSGETIAKIYFNKETRRKIFLAFRSKSNQLKDQRIKFHQKLKKQPQTLKIVLEYLAMSMTGKSKINLLKFHSMVITQEKVKYQFRKTFSQSIEQTLVYQMRNVFKGWKSFVDQILSFKQQVRNKKTQLVLNTLRNKMITNKKAKIQVLKVFMNVKYRALLNLRLNADFQLLLKKKQSVVHRRFKKRIFNRFFTNWRSLFFQYKSIMVESTEKKLISNANFLKKYFQALKNHSAERMREKNQRLKSMMHYYDRYLKNCFSSWRQISSKSCLLKKAKRVVKYNNELDRKDIFFKEWMRKCYFNEMMRRQRIKKLKTKFLQSLQLAVRYKKVRKEILIISQDQYLRSLQLKVLRSLRVKIDIKEKLRTIENAFVRKTHQVITNKIFEVLKQNVEENQNKREQSEIVERFRTSQLYFKYFDKLRAGTQKQKVLKQNYYKVQSYVQSKIKFRTLQKFAQKLDSKQQLKYYQFQLLYRKQMSIKQKIFSFMLNKKRDLNHKFFQVHEIIRFKNKATIFRLWYQAACQIQHMRNGYYQLQSHQVNNTLEKHWKLWNQYVEQTVLQRKYKQVAIYFFLQKFLKKYLFALRNHALIKIQKRKILFNLGMHRFKHQFLSFKKVLVKDIQKKKVYFKQISTILKKVINNWNRYASKRRYLRQNKIMFRDKHDQIVKLQIIEILKDNKACLGLCEQDQYKYMKQRKQQLVIEKLNHYSQKSKNEKQKYQKIRDQQQSQSVAENFNLWHQLYQLSKKERQLAVPFFNQIQTVTKAQVFFNWRFYSNRQGFFKGNGNLIENKHKIKIKQSHFKIMKFYSLKKRMIKQKEKSIQENHRKYQRQLVITFLKKYHHQRQHLQLCQEQLTKITQLNTFSRYLKQWTDRYNRWINFKPKLEKADQLYNYLNARKAFNHFKEFLSLIKKKREMLKSIELYRQELQIHRAFQKLKDNYDLSQKVLRFNYRSQVQFKSTCFQQWRQMYQQQVKLKRQALNQQKLLYLLQNHRKLLKKQSFEGFKLVLQDRQKKYHALFALDKFQLKIQVRQSFENFKEYTKEQQKVEVASIHQESFKKHQVIKALKFFINNSKLNQTMNMQADAFTRLITLKKVLKSLQNNQEKTHQMRQVYARTNKAYRKQLLQKALWTLHWNKMRNHYLRGLFFKSGEYNDQRIKQKLFTFLKKQLIVKYQGLSIMQKREYRVLSDYLSFWRYQYEQKEALRELQDYNQKVKTAQQNQYNNSSSFNMNLNLNTNNFQDLSGDPNFGLNLSVNDRAVFSNSMRGEGIIENQDEGTFSDDDN